MNLCSKNTIKTLFQKYQTKPIKQLGQNFLINEKIIKKTIEAAGISLNDIVLEIGPGIGTLTIELAKRVKRVIAIEKDPKMVEILRETLKGYKNVEIIQKDVLELTTSSLQLTADYRIVANLPYYIVSPVIRKFLELENPPKEMILMVQKEVGQRICAKPPNMSILAISVQFYAEPKIISYVSKASFWPQPKVDGAIIKIIPKAIRSDLGQACPRSDLEQFFKIVRAGFAHPRKQLINNLSNGLKIDKIKTKEWLLKNNIQPSQRAETLSVENWLSLANEDFNF